MNSLKEAKVSLSILCLLSLFLAACQPVVFTPTTIPQATDAEIAIPTSTPTPLPLPTVTSTPTPTFAPESDFIKGVWFVDWGLGEGVDTLDGTVVLRDIIHPLGANWIAIQLPCSMDIKTPNIIKCNVDNSLPDSAIVNVTNTAHSLGLRVALFPFVLDVTGVPGNWSAGMDFGSSAGAWSMYFDAYADQLLHYAELAEQNNIDLLIIGGEQTGAHSQEEHWRALISQVRVVYHGPITYEAWCQHFKTVHWWDAVDYIGVNFYCFPLSKSQNPRPEEVKKNYLKFLEMVKTGTSRWNKPVIFTEIGYQSVNGVSQIVPFGYPPVLLDVEEQGILAQGFFDALKEFGNDDGWLKGLFWYNFTSNPLLGGAGDINFTPHNKPAEEYLRAYYTNQPVANTPAPIPQFEEGQIVTSYWLFSDQLENGTRIGPSWTGTSKQTIVADPIGERGDVISVRNIDYGEGYRLEIFPPIKMRDFDFIELYLYSPVYEPNLPIHFEDSGGQWIPRWLYIRSFIDHEPLLDRHWHRIQIPLATLFPTDRPDIQASVSYIYFVHNWPGQPGPITFFMDDVRLIKVKQ